ncbi:MAG: hypothetical protein AAFP98_07415 [Pseudomonadota bacterium]
MKSAILATALVAVASVAAADDDTVNVVSATPAGAGQYEVVSVEGGLYTLSLINCLPMMAGVLDTDDEISDLVNNGGADMIEVERGTTEHAIATYACEG